MDIVEELEHSLEFIESIALNIDYAAIYFEPITLLVYTEDIRYDILIQYCPHIVGRPWSYFAIDDYKIWLYNGFILSIKAPRLGNIQRRDGGGYVYRNLTNVIYVNEPGNLLVSYRNNYKYILDPDQFYMGIDTKFGKFTYSDDGGLELVSVYNHVSSYSWRFSSDSCYNFHGEAHPAGYYKGIGINRAPLGYYYNLDVWTTPEIIPGVKNRKNTRITIINETPVLYDFDIPTILNIQDLMDHCNSFEFE